MSEGLPAHAGAVVIGGGIVGTSVAYHLTKRGWRDVVLCDRTVPTSGTTWYAAGLITQLRATFNMSMLAKYSGDLFPEIERLTGMGTGFLAPGCGPAISGGVLPNVGPARTRTAVLVGARGDKPSPPT